MTDSNIHSVYGEYIIFRVDSALRALSTLRGLRGAPEVPPICRETQSLEQHMLELSCENATVGTNGLKTHRGSVHDSLRSDVAEAAGRHLAIPWSANKMQI